MKKITLQLKGHNYWDNPVYEGDGRLYVDLNPDGAPALHTISGNDFDGEPEAPISSDIKIAFNPKRKVGNKDNRFRYMMLSRWKGDCDYYLGYGNRYPGHLPCGNEKEHIKKMKDMWNSLPKRDKPEWLTWEDILAYERQMVDIETDK